ncbi:WD repeat-containing protein LWD2-like [Punica granatum]|uniref:Uncharacterized protein n=2 Tax=Punica granatum TaxID=22663 RepID=A0A218XCV3_PUNGR|nr:WD repeat-containing protein LWD2-like [Punica granatum]XP_031397651.1 WD repeat-containing protein LWD2-like [Punica granatum]XP_031397652.1 WD repeat-containing protein LWD2-like [Punica granatum]OWM82550.1 hypothetical protein CDL15_Pgr002125 [Punica granatum]PKI47041.1 hypothetical protein CRG98_032580 [Punica granatum]
MSSVHVSMQSQAVEQKTASAAGVYTYVAQWPIYAVAWSHHRAYSKPRLAIGSFLEDYANKVELVQFDPDTSNFSTDGRLVFDHPYAPTNVMFLPSEADAASSTVELLATSGDYLRLWAVHHDRVEMRALLNSNRGSEFSSAITSFDWAAFNPRHIAGCSVDTTCTVWDVEKEVVEAQLVAHDKEVYDVSWGGTGVFASVSGDGSVRVFDLRDKERSTIIYENVTAPNRDQSPLLRLEWNKADPRFMATVGMDSSAVVILDIRFPTAPLAELNRHRGSVNAVSWAPQVGRQLCSVGDDSRALIWDVLSAVGLSSDGNVAVDVEPEMWYGSTLEINNVRWSPVEMDWIALTFSNKLQLLRV